MIALILNSGIGKRMGELTKSLPKCMVNIGGQETIISRQLKQLAEVGIKEVVITTGPFEETLRDYCISLDLPLNYIFVNNPVYDKTNYIYSIYLAREYLEKDMVSLHGDLVFETEILADMLNSKDSFMAVSSTAQLPEKDFKAVIDNEQIKHVSIDCFENAYTAQPLYKLNKEEWMKWLDQIIKYCEAGQVSCYAENAFNEISEDCIIWAFDYKDSLCGEIDTLEDLEITKGKLQELDGSENDGNG